ncbi:cold-shock protein [Malaciobacter molluscorum LMG 25693]|uniref:Cold shock protein n=1 Tax=Malaciobacter molluscorum LMG 25693 TaxID=870501 RepID=A0A2G1DJ22_9BACT|nr:cold shock domain-containing protein [Malaciobacter molluscorum]AXX93234.1 cold shock protein [Malaciobacter molluscorum LMG 25693]PHO18487.1 cold-shock protein [Malaciobacter molluscorum LMG 25693]RXJ95688.1 cold-shock protein [Malaciobacter molluscorum]
MSNRYNGTVKWFNSEKGFGFIQLEDNSKDIFVHHTEISEHNNKYEKATLKDGQMVTFNIGANQKGEHATNVEPK